MKPAPPPNRCTQCNRLLQDGEPVVLCTTCGRPFHPECWNTNGRCGILGCQGVPTAFQAWRAAPKTDVPPAAPEPDSPPAALKPEAVSAAPERAVSPAAFDPTPDLPERPASAEAFSPNPEAAPAAAGGRAAQPGLVARVKEIWQFIEKNETLLWWMHSGWALLFGIGVMWLGAKNFTYLRIAGLYIGFIWLSSLMLPVVLGRLRVSARWKERIRLVINYFNRNFTQQIIFFVIPIYWKSATANSRNMWFIFLLVISAILSSLDIVYDRIITVKWAFFTIFFVFNVFSGLYLLLTLIWDVGNAVSIYLSAGVAIFAFASLSYRLSGFRRVMKWVFIILSSGCLFLAAHFGRYIIPPAPLHFGRVIFAEKIDRDREKNEIVVRSALSNLPVAAGGDKPTTIFSLIPVKSPLGLKEDLVQSYYLNGEKVFNVDFERGLTGVLPRERIRPMGKINGEILWKVLMPEWYQIGPANYVLISFVSLYNIPPHSVLQVDVETAHGQLIGRDELATED